MKELETSHQNYSILEAESRLSFRENISNILFVPKIKNTREECEKTFEKLRIIVDKDSVKYL